MQRRKKVDMLRFSPQHDILCNGQTVELFDQLNVMVDDIPIPLIVVDNELAVIVANSAAMALVHPTLSTLPTSLPDIVPLVNEFAESGRTASTYNNVAVRFDYGKRYMRIKISRITNDRLLLCFEDRTDIRHLLSQLKHAQKMEAIGTLASGIAHDFNNILTVIGGYADIIKRKVSDEALVRSLEQIYIVSGKGTSLIKSLLMFSRKSEPEFSFLNVNSFVKNVVTVFERVLRDDISLKVLYHHEDIYTLADEVQLEQVIVNLLTNAQDAMPDGGSITIHVGKGMLNNDEYILIKVTDEGFGIDHVAMDQIFEPFFTTKPPNQGTGLGLSMAKSIIRDHGGHILCDSIVNQGSVFRVYLPMVSSASN